MATISGGDDLEKRMAELAKGLAEGGEVSIGFLEGATYPDGTGVPFVAAMNEFGVPSHGQPPRPFFRRMIAAKSGKWGDGVAAALKRTGYKTKPALAIVGEGISGQLKQSINELVDPPLAPSTIAAKGFDKPLIDTSTMINAVNFEVHD